MLSWTLEAGLRPNFKLTMQCLNNPVFLPLTFNCHKLSRQSGSDV